MQILLGKVKALLKALQLHLREFQLGFQLLILRILFQLVRQRIDLTLRRVALLFQVARVQAKLAVGISHLLLGLVVCFLRALNTQIRLFQRFLGLHQLAVHAVVDVDAGAVVVRLRLFQRAQGAFRRGAGAVDGGVQAVVEIFHRVLILLFTRGDILRRAVFRDGKRNLLLFQRFFQRLAVKLA